MTTFDRLERAVAGSTLCRGARLVDTWLRPRPPARNPYAKEDARLAAQRNALVADSRVAVMVEDVVSAARAAWRFARVTRMFADVEASSRADRIRTAAGVIIVATLTQTVLLMALDGPVSMPGWMLRAALIGGSLLVARQPDRLAAAWASMRWRSPH